MDALAQQLINGLSIGAIYALIAVGYTMVYGILRLINFAHGDVYMIGAMVGLYVATGRFDALAAPWPLHPLTLAAFALVLWLGSAKLQLAYLSELGRTLMMISGVIVVASLLTRGIAVVGLPSWLGFGMVLLAAMSVCAGLGVLIELLAYRPMRSSDRIYSLITAIGVSMLLMYGGQAVFGPTPQAFPQLIPGASENPNLFTLSIGEGSFSFSKINALIVGLTLVLMLVLRHLVLFTRPGLALRAVSFRFDTASLMGVDVNRAVRFTFIIGSALAAAGGVMIAQAAPKVEPLMGLMMGLKAFVAAVLGGIGNIPGAVAGGILLGLTETLVAGYLPQGSQYRDGVAFVILIGVLLLRPSGILGEKIVEKV